MGQVAAPAPELGQLFWGFDALAHGLEAEGLGQRDHGGDRGAVTGVRGVHQARDEGAVDLQDVSRDRRLG